MQSIVMIFASVMSGGSALFDGVLGQLFREPLSVPTNVWSQLWAIPICLCIAVVYKAVKLDEIKLKPFVREVSLLFVTIIAFLIMVALVLLGISWLVW